MKYKTILADPPWNYNNAGFRGSCEKHYSTMSIKNICALPVFDLADDDSVLLEWCTWPQLREGLEVMQAWGFQYVTGFPWVKVTDVSITLWNEIEIKVPYGIGFWSRGCTEFVLIGRRGKANPPDKGFIGLLSPNLFHSRKPDDIYEYAESLPGPYLELFARRERPGWDVFGNEVSSSIQIETCHNKQNAREVRNEETTKT